MDCLLLHIPKFSSTYLPLGEFLNITYMPMGLPALANRLNREGFETEILHLGVEWIRDPAWSAVDEAAASDAPMIGADLYWHYQTFDVLDVAERIKARRPDVFFFLGGTTAGYFAVDILKRYPFIDAVVRGDGEIAIVELAEAIRGKRAMADVANLVWRDADGRVVQNTKSAFSDQAMLDSLVFGDLSALRNREIYVESFGFPLAYPKQFDHERNRVTQRMGRSFFPLFVGRGCAWECTFCGGNRKTLRELNGHPTMRFRSVDRVVDDIELALGHGYRTMALCFDPTPQKDDYYVSMFQEIRRRKLEVDFYFECWGLPTQRFLEEWNLTFGRGNTDSYLALSPDAGDEAVRRRNKQPFYTDAEFWAAMDMCEEMGVTADVFFTIALPGETIETARKTKAMIERIEQSYSITRRVMVWSVQLEPGSPQFERPESLGMITDRKHVEDFRLAHGTGADTYATLGYKIEGFFGDHRDQGGIAEFEAHLQSLKCMEFCFLSEDPRRPSTPAEGRKVCHSRRRELAARVDVKLADLQREIDESHRYADAAKTLAQALPVGRPRWP